MFTKSGHFLCLPESLRGEAGGGRSQVMLPTQSRVYQCAELLVRDCKAEQGGGWPYPVN